MSSIWSDYVQKAGTLYLSRQLRFHDTFSGSFKEAFSIPVNEGLRILEIGCGPGALAQSLHRWYPKAEVTGLDFDENLIKFAQKAAPELDFITGDATAMPFSADNFDVTISNTVSEHIEPEKFYREQHRVLKKGGICLMLSTRRGINLRSPVTSEMTALESEVWGRVEERFKKFDEEIGVGKYSQSEAGHAKSMEKFGFRDISTDYIAINLTPDDPKYPREMALAMINDDRQNQLDGLSFLREKAADLVSKAETNEMERAINERFDKRISLYDSRQKQWDTQVILIMVLRGVK